MFAAIFIPDFFLQAVLRHEPAALSQAVVLLTDSTNKAAVWQMTDAAAREGIVPGIPSTQAQARCGSIQFRFRSAPQEQAAQEVLLECAYGFAAYIEATEPGVCTMDLRELPVIRAEKDDHLLTARLETWAGRILKQLEQFHLRARIGIGATPGLALQAARAARPFLRVTDPGAFRAELPIESIAPPSDIRDILQRWGITTTGQFLDLGKDALGERLGPEGIRLFELAAAETIRPLRLTVPAEIYVESFDFEQEIETIEPLLFILRRFLDQLTARLELKHYVVQELALTLRLASGHPHARSFTIPAPTGDVDVLFRILYNHLETVRAEAPVTGLALEARPCRPEQQQFELFETAVRDPNRFFETVGRLNALLGQDRAGTPFVEQTHRPDDFQIRNVRLRIEMKKERGAEGQARPRGLALRRFRPPIPARVEWKRERPGAFESSKGSGTIAEALGPWRSSGNWWERSWDREGWDVQTRQGALYRLYREEGKWFVEGVYD